MSESGLGINFNNMADRITSHLGWGAFSTISSSDKVAVRDMVNRAYRMFLFSSGHEWNFLRIPATITTTADDDEYDLPDNWGGFRSKLFYGENQLYPPLEEKTAKQILEMRASSLETGIPSYFASQSKALDAGVSGQRWEVLIYPTPDQAYTLSYFYIPFIDNLSDEMAGEDPAPIYPIGGARHGETLLCACELIASRQWNREDFKLIDSLQRDYDRALAASIAADVKTVGPRIIGSGNKKTPRYIDRILDVTVEI